MDERRPSGLMRDDSGAVAATYALALFALVAIGGVAFDYARMAGMDSELQNAADQAALAAATQLDQRDGSCARSINAAVGMVTNDSLLGNGTAGTAVTVNSDAMVSVADDQCGAAANVVFYTTKEKTTVATTDEDARFVEVTVDAQTADMAFTPIVGFFTATLEATAFAGVGSAICEVPPLMICSPTPGASFNAAARRGWGIKATGHGGGAGAWSPGDFGFLEVGAGSIAELAEALAFDQSTLDCSPIEGTQAETGNAQVLYDAINTRFDIMPTSVGGGATLGPCTGTACPPALNVTKDVVKTDATSNNNQCQLGNNGWKLPPVGERFRPRAYLAADTKSTRVDADSSISSMGLTRDLCHYNSYNVNCRTRTGISSVNDPNTRFGDGWWGIADYFHKYHPAATLATGATVDDPKSATATPHRDWSRYDVYLWEIARNNMPLNPTAATGSLNQYGRPKCLAGTPGDIDRRVLTVAVVKNCSGNGGSNWDVEVDEWVDMFFVEPVVDDSTERANGRDQDMIYMEVIGPSFLGEGAAASTTQTIRKDKPYLIE